jgi:cytochrome c nitrite reductase small subunit
VRVPLLIGTAALIGVAVGLGAFTFGYARGYSYLTNDPAACANCHIMDEHYGAWLKSSHRSVAGCNDCHTPHDPVGKYTTKARNGFWHSFYFTTGRFPYPLRITERNHEIVEHNCRYCHEHITETIDHGVGASSAHAGPDIEPLRCTRCHVSVGHWVR